MTSRRSPTNSTTASISSMDKLEIDYRTYRTDLEQPFLLSMSANKSAPFLPDKACGESDQ